MIENPDYRSDSCANCGRLRVEWDGICEKCGWDNDKGRYSEPKPLPENPIVLDPIVPKQENGPESEALSRL